MTSRPIRFYHRGRIVELDRVAPTRSVLDWLREDARCTGTKEGCNEGDCGACTVVLGTPAAPDDTRAVRGLALRTVNACIQFLPMLDGKALFTVEDLAPLAGGALHPVQQALVQCHGSQCGFCTPGFVMSLFQQYEQHRAGGSTPSRQALADALAGNLCRCTGYRPILDAGQQMFSLPPVALDTTPVLAALATLAQDSELRLNHAGQRWHAPRSLGALATLRQQRPDAQLLAGATDVGLWVNKQLRHLPEIIDLGAVAELKAIETRDDGRLWIGAGASLEEAWHALARRWPSLTDLWLRFAAPPVRHAGTLGGNVANGSPIGDCAPVLLALDAELDLRQGDQVRRVPLHGFYLDYMKNSLARGEFLQAVVVPPLPAQRQVRAYKISKRFDCDISALCAGFSVELDGDTVRHVRLAFGGMAATVRRALRAEAALLGRPWDAQALAAAQQALAQDFSPLTDLRASDAHRRQVAANLLQRFWLETRPQDPLPAQAVSVFADLRAGVA
ncbi:xanthine dehydrogenase, small subunit [Burkholderiales bacterium JOSHI_001]|nr:xanthine dehydrogenase, small subunit [Burkholderiales bacterium JOSHI_001]